VIAMPPRQARDWVRTLPRRHFCVLYTPFLPDGSLDEAGLRHNTRMTLARPGLAAPGAAELTAAGLLPVSESGSS